MAKHETPPLSADKSGHILSLRERLERDFLALAFDYFRENAIFGDVHEYGCDLRPVLPSAVAVSESVPIPGMKFFGFAAFQEPRVAPGRTPKTAAPLEAFVRQSRLEEKLGGKATLRVGPTPTTLAKSERDRFMNLENKVALAIIHAPASADAKAALEFAEPLLTEGSLVYFADLNSGYRRTPAKDVGRVFLEFQQHSRFQYVRFLDVGWWGRAYTTCLPAELPLEKL